MAKISDVQKERELIGLFLLSRECVSHAIDNGFTPADVVDKFNKQVLKIIHDKCLLDLTFLPTINYIIDELNIEEEKEKKKTLVKLNRYKKMIQRELQESQYKDVVQSNILELKDLTIKRRVIHVLKDGLEKIDIPAREFLSTINRALVQIELNDGLIKEVSIYNGFKDLKAEMEEQKRKGIQFGFKTHLRDIDKMIQDNIAKKTLTYIVGRPSNYKTGLALNMASNMAQNNIPTAFFSHEMDGPAIYRRLLSRVAKIDMNRIKQPDILTTDEWAAIDSAIKEVELWPLYVVDAANLNIAEIPSVVATLKSNYGVEVVFEDYFQLIRTKKGTIPTEEGEFGEISEELRMIAKEFDVAMIALSQANRKCESRDDKRPTLQDIRSTGKAEMDAHNVFYVYRDEFYYHSQSEVPNHMEFGALKIREGELKKVLLHFNGGKATIGNADPMVLMDRSIDYVGGGGYVG
jgi:replicative DNA helicase